MSEQKKDIVKYDNKFNLSNLNKLGVIEQNLFFSIISEFTKTKEMAIKINLGELKRKAKVSDSNITEKQFEKLVLSANEKILHIIFHVYKDDEYYQMPLFSKFRTNFTEERIIIELNPPFSNYLFNIPEKIGFSRFELEKFIFLRSKYSKILFRHLLEHHRGEWKIEVKKFREILGIPESYSSGMLLKTIKKIIPELENSGYFNNLNFTPTYSRKQGRPMSDLVFTYTVNPLKQAEQAGQTTILDYDYATKTIEKPEIEFSTRADGTPVAIETIKTIEQEEHCPKCGAKIIIKTNKNGEKYRCCENSGYWRLGTADCNFYEK